MLMSTRTRRRLGTRHKGLRLFGDDGQTYSQKISNLFGASIIGWWKQAEPVGTPVAGTGTIAQNLTAVVGVGTVFLSQLQVGDLLIGTGISGYVTVIADDTNLTLSSTTTVAATSFTYTRNISIDSSGQANNGLYRFVTLGQPGIGDGLTSASYNGTTSFDNIYSAALNADFNGQSLTLAAWCMMSAAGIWTDGLSHRIAQLRVNASNTVFLQKDATNNTLSANYTAGATAKAVTSTILGGVTGLFHLAMTASLSGDAMIFYINGVPIGVTQTGLGTWAGALSSTLTVIGAASTVPATIWDGRLAHVVLLNRPATAGEVAQMAVL